MKKIWKRVKYIIIALWLSQILYTIALNWINPLITPNMIVSIYKNRDNDYKFHHHNIPYREMGDNIKWSVVASEDQKFADHWGIDFSSLKKAIGSKKEKKRGASTITQQTAKNLFLVNDRSWIRKALETYFTFVLEICLPKRTILKHYLNIAEMGPNIYGIDAAAKYHFNKKPQDLTAREAAFIAAVLPSPVKRSTSTKNIATSKAGWILKQIPYLKGDAKLVKVIEHE